MERLRNKLSKLTGNPKMKLALLLAVILAMNVLASCGSDAGDSMGEDSETFGIVEDYETEKLETEDDSEMESYSVTEVSEEIAATEIEAESETGMETEAGKESGTESESEGTEANQSESSTSNGVVADTEDASVSGDNNSSDPASDARNAMDSYTITAMDKTMYAKQAVNVRILPSTDGDNIGALYKDESVTVTGQCDETGWYQISYNGLTGYCSNNYLTDTKPDNNSASGTSGESASSDGSASGNSGGNTGSSGTNSKSSESGSGSNSGSSGSSSESDSESSGGNTDIEDEEGYPEVTDELLAEYAQEVIELTNKERKAAGLSALKMNTILMECAQIRAEEQVESFGHTRPDGSDCMTVIPDEYGCIEGGEGTENAAYGTWTGPERVMEMWMDSPLHCGNILDEDIDEIGVGVYFYNDDFYYVQIFTNGLHKHTWSSETEVIVFGSLGGEEVECYVCEYDGCEACKRASDGSLIK